MGHPCPRAHFGWVCGVGLSPYPETVTLKKMSWAQCGRAVREPAQAVTRAANYRVVVVIAALEIWLTSWPIRDTPYLKSVGYRLSKKSCLTSSPRLRTPTFSKTLRRWFWTVCSEIKSVREIRVVERPRTTSFTSSSSRGLRPQAVMLKGSNSSGFVGSIMITVSAHRSGVASVREPWFCTKMVHLRDASGLPIRQHAGMQRAKDRKGAE